jgi:periplasmic copper chaperone A
MKRLVPILAAALAVAACESSAPQLNDSATNGQHRSAEASGPIFQLPVIPGRPGAAYFTLEVPAGHGALVGVTSPQAGRIEMHETMRRGSMSGMRPLERIVPENGRIVLERGGRHLMLFDVNAALAAGGNAQLVLRFEQGQTRTLDARVISAENAHAGH